MTRIRQWLTVDRAITMATAIGVLALWLWTTGGAWAVQRTTTEQTAARLTAVESSMRNLDDTYVRRDELAGIREDLQLIKRLLMRAPHRDQEDR